MPDELTVQPLMNDGIRQKAAGLNDWKIVSSPLPGDSNRLRTELTRQFHFSSFEQAISFMQAAVPHINMVHHHPRWENEFKTVTVWLTTWDAGQTISQRDISLARYLDALFAQSKSLSG